MQGLATKHNDPEARLGWGERLGYGSGQLGMNAINAVIGSFLTIYFTNAALLDAGIIAELGASYELGDYGSFYLLGRYQYGLTSLAKGSYMAAHSYFDNICVDIGFLWRVI